MPAEEAVKDLNETANIGTGPFKLAEWVPASHATLERFDDYSPNTDFEGPTGFGGNKTAYLDHVTFRIMTEASTRVAALEAGEVQLAEDIPVPAAARLREEPGFSVYQIDNFNMPVLFLNNATGPTSNLKFRQAIQAALDMDQIMAGATDGLYTLDPSWLWPGNPYYTDVGKELYNINDMDRAKALLAESGYANEPVTLLISNISFHMKIGAIVTEQLRQLGLNLQPQTVDYATLIATTQTDDGWNLATNGFSSAPFLGAFAYQSTFTGPTNWARIKSDPAMEEAWNTFNTSLDEDTRKAAWAKVQQLTYENVQTIKLGNQGFLISASNTLKGYDPYIGGERMWNVWLGE
jgi:peptide/nickel transport system substrate-binding protein